jgi:hypothetical protein
MKYLIMFMLLCSTCFAQEDDYYITSTTLNYVADHGGPIRYIGLVGAAPQTHQFRVNDTVLRSFAQGRSMRNMVQTICNDYGIPYERAATRYYGLTNDQKRVKYVYIQFEKNQGFNEQQCTKMLVDYTEALTTSTTLTSATLQSAIDKGNAANTLRKQYEAEAEIVFP